MGKNGLVISVSYTAWGWVHLIVGITVLAGFRRDDRSPVVGRGRHAPQKRIRSMLRTYRDDMGGVGGGRVCT